jgi:putative two-component system response regulator
MSLESLAYVDTKAARIYIVDDEPVNVRLLERILKNSGYTNLTCFGDGRQLLAHCETQLPDLIMLDLMMPGFSGYQVMEQTGTLPDGKHLPILVLTADSTPSARERALSGGAKDFVTKPFDQVEVLLRVKNLLETHFLYLDQRDRNRELEERVQERTHDLMESKLALEESQIEMLQRLAQAAEFRDDDTGQHTRRVGDMAAMLAQQLGLAEERVALIRRAAPLHDVGKIGVSDLILLKPGKLTAEEFATMKTHAAIGAALLKDGQSPLVQVAEIIARSHHEKWDGNGYPLGLKGEEIPIEGRILAVVDVFDALTNERPYKKAWPVEEALAEIERSAGTHFDPQVVAAFLLLFPKRF